MSDVIYRWYSKQNEGTAVSQSVQSCLLPFRFTRLLSMHNGRPTWRRNRGQALSMAHCLWAIVAHDVCRDCTPVLYQLYCVLL